MTAIGFASRHTSCPTPVETQAATLSAGTARRAKGTARPENLVLHNVSASPPPRLTPQTQAHGATRDCAYDSDCCELRATLTRSTIPASHRCERAQRSGATSPPTTQRGRCDRLPCAHKSVVVSPTCRPSQTATCRAYRRGIGRQRRSARTRCRRLDASRRWPPAFSGGTMAIDTVDRRVAPAVAAIPYPPRHRRQRDHMTPLVEIPQVCSAGSRDRGYA